MRIYIAGPYAHPDPVENSRKAIMAAESLVKMGHTPFVPHLTLMWHLVAPHDVEFWYRYDLIWLYHCEGVLRLPGKSKGADNEVEFAIAEDIPVYYNVAEIPTVGVTVREFDRICREFK